MKELSNKDLKKISLGVLEEFDRICRDNNIIYSIAYGTLLGAVRHGGFIPWDDDIDVIMLRDEYEKFLKVKHKLKKEFLLVSLDTDTNYTAPLPKLVDTRTELIEYEHRDKFKLGVYIDIFIFDYYSENKLKKEIYKIRTIVANKLWGFATYKPKSKFFLESLLRNIALKMNLGRKASIILELLNKGNTSSAFVSNLQYSVYGIQKDIFLYKDLKNVKNIKFESLNVLAFENKEIFLNKWYGDFMKLPPVNKRVSHHNFIVYYKN